MNSYQVTYSIGGLGEVRLTVYTDVDKDSEDFDSVIDKLCMEDIIREVSDYGAVKSFD